VNREVDLTTHSENHFSEGEGVEEEQEEAFIY
jgi:hypothetical protein